MRSQLATWHLRACLGAVALMLTVPFLMAHHYSPIPTFFQEWTAAVLSLAALTWLLRGAGSKPLEAPEIALLPVGLMLIAVFQALLLPAALTDRLLLFGLYMVWAILLVVLGRRLADEVGLETLADIMASAILVGALLEAFSGGAQLAGQDRLPWIFPHLGGGLRGNLGQPNSFADYLWLGVAAAIYLRSRKLLGRTAAGTALLLLLPFAVLSGSRSLWFYAAGLVLLSAAWWPWRRCTPAAVPLRRWSLGALAASFACQLAFSSGLVPLPDNLVTAGGRLADSGSYDPLRMALWRIALDTFLENPWLGAGFGQYTRQFQLQVLDLMPRYLPGLPENAHNILLNFMAEMGLAAGLLLVFFTLRWILALIRGPRTPAGWWVAATLLILAIHANLEYPLWYTFFLSIAALLAGAGSRSNHILRLGPRAPYAMAAFLALGAFTLANLWRDYNLLEDTFNWRITADSADEFRRRVAANLETLARESLLRPYVDLAAAYLQSEDSENLHVKLATCDRAQRFSANREIIFKCTHLLALGGHDEEARLALRQAVAAYPEQAKLVLQQWRRRAPSEPAIARLVADFPPIARAAP